ncbi:hypothetical protein [Chryseobacterium binzhouense]|uniref:hypothetical protein n=1 Tax=Chryseobacterium binzhouense TaxID=2593646 RepID=UPI00289DC6BF|nr:hypothetical protein [Chryseobacterium binzhouense]
MKIQLLLPFFILLFALNSCQKNIKSEKGGIDLISNIYFDASKGLDQMQSFHLSKLNYSKNQFIELVPDHTHSEVNKQIYFIEDSICYSIGASGSNVIFKDLSKKQISKSVWEKKEGAVFSKDWIPNYRNRKNLSDTLLFNKKYKRFEINSPWNYTRFYIYPTDTILPYSFYRHAENDYNGRLERIDSYNKKTDIFVTLQLLPRKSWDDEAKELFEFNHFINNRKN